MVQDAESGVVTKSEPYMFNVYHVPGYTYSIKSDDTGDVLAVDIASSSLSAYLTEQQTKMQFLVSAEMYVYQGSGDIIASSRTQSHQHTFDDLSALIKLDDQKTGLANKRHQFGKMLDVHENGIEKYMFVVPLPLSGDMQADNDDFFTVLVAKEDVLAVFREKIRISILITSLCLLLLLPISWFFACINCESNFKACW